MPVFYIKHSQGASVFFVRIVPVCTCYHPDEFPENALWQLYYKKSGFKLI